VSAAYLGKYTSGQGQASHHLASYDEQFNCRMVGTFNVQLKGVFAETPCIETHNRWYWFAMLSQGNEGRYCWVTRDKGSEQPKRIVEIITKSPLPDLFKTGQVELEIFDRWPHEQAREWADGQYWFQSWPWTPTQKANSQFVWDTIKDTVDWAGKRVLDIGGNAGFHAFRAAEAGAQCLVVEPSDATRRQGKVIAEHIEQQDVLFTEIDPGRKFDVILYLSVHHRINMDYGGLPETLIDLGNRANDVLVELHTERSDSEPPVRPFTHWSRNEIDGMFSAKLVTYRHNLRCERTVYKL